MDFNCLIVNFLFQVNMKTLVFRAVINALCVGTTC